MSDVSIASSSSSPEMTLDTYSFPVNRMSMQQEDPNRTPLVLVACGSFSPISALHLRMQEIAKDYARSNTNYEVMGGWFSPVSDAYLKAGLAPSYHRVRMCDLAVEEAPDWLMVDPWEALQPQYSPTAAVLDHFDYEINQKLGGVYSADGETKRRVQIKLLAGADLIETMSTPGVWSERDLDHILNDFGAMIIERSGIHMKDALANLKRWEDNIIVVPQLVTNDISSTKIRLFLKRHMSVKWLTPHSVVQYMKDHGLYGAVPDSPTKTWPQQKASDSDASSAHKKPDPHSTSG